MPTWGEFVTTRGQIPYSMAVDGLHEDYPTDGSPRTFYTVCRVKADLAKAFREAMLPDVDNADTSAPGQTLLLDAWDTESTAPTYQRRALTRKLPEQHPEHVKAWCVRVTLLRGEGVPQKSDTFWMTFQQDNAGAQVPGFVAFGVTWQDLPYNPTAGNLMTLNGRQVPDETTDNTTVNSTGHSELERYCWVRPISKTTALQVRGNFFYFLNDDGTPLVVTGAGTGVRSVATGTSGANLLPIQGDNAAPTIPFGFTAFQITWYMIPRIPRGVYTLRNMVNKVANITFDSTIVPETTRPEIGTLLYIGPEGPMRPYFTVTDRPVYDLTLNFLYRRGARGPTEPARGHNAVFCPVVRQFRRVLAGPVTGAGFDTAADADLANLPTATNPIVSGSNPGHNIYDYGDLANIFKFTT